MAKTSSKGGSTLTADDKTFLKLACTEAKAGYEEGGCPIGSVIAEGKRLVAQGRNQRFRAATRSPMARWTRCARPDGRRATRG